MQDYSRNEKDIISEALISLNLWFLSNNTVRTRYGLQNTKSGYRIHKIHITPAQIKIDVYVLSRSVQEYDKVRRKDLAKFAYCKKAKRIRECPAKRRRYF